MSGLLQDLRYGLRQLVRSPGFTAVAVLTLGLGIGANVAIFSLFEQLLLRPPPVHEPERLVNLGAPGPKPGAISCGQAGDCDQVFSFPMFRDLSDVDAPLTGLAGHVAFWASLSTRDQTLIGEGLFVSGRYFEVLGLAPALGRLIGPDDDRVPGDHPQVVLNHSFWTTHLGADPSVLDRTMVVNGQPLTIVGVAPAGFDGITTGIRPQIFVPLSMRAALTPAPSGIFEDRRSYWLYVFGRLAPGATLEQARQALDRSYEPILREVEAPLQLGMSEPTMERFLDRRLTVEDGRRGQTLMHEEATPPLALLLAITGIVLLITCANVANLLLVRAAARQQELAVRTALGAGRFRLVRQLFAEAGLLALFGGVVSLVAARWTLAALGTFLPPEALAFIELELSGVTLAVAAVLALGTALLFGLVPSIQAARAGFGLTLRGGAGQTGGRGGAHFRAGLVCAQIALSTALLISAGLFARSLLNVQGVDLGLDVENVIAFDVSPGMAGYDPESSRRFFGQLAEVIQPIPGVLAVSQAQTPILRRSSWSDDVRVEGFDAGPDTDVNAARNGVGAGYFRTLGIPLLAGREFTEADAESAAGVVIVNEAFTRKFDLDPLEAVGMRMALGRAAVDLDLEIVGVVRDASYAEVRADPPPTFFTPWRQGSAGTLTFYVRTGSDPAPVLSAVPGIVRGLDRDIPVASLTTMEGQVRENIFLDRMIGGLTTGFAALASLLAGVGLFGVVSYTVAQRTREIGIRMALGAGAARVRRLVLGQVGWMTLVGGVVGVVAALGLGRAARSLLFEVEAHDPWSLLGGVILLSAVALAAGYLPARRAARVDPMVALRGE
jgi:predicted permease